MTTRWLLLALATTSFFATDAFAKCIPANELVPFEEGPATAKNKGKISLGSYSRISPDGRFIIRSLSGPKLSTVTVMEIRTGPNGKKVAHPYQTSLGLEAFPVQGSWRFIADTGRNHYKMADIINHEKDAPKAFSAGERGFYAAAAELEGGTDKALQIRSLSWPGQNGVGQLAMTTAKIEKKGSSYKVKDSKRIWPMCKNLNSTEGTNYTLPMISLDGTEFAAMPISPKNKKPSMRIYAITDNSGNCAILEDLGFGASKAIFGPAREGKKAPLVFLGSGNMTSGNTPVSGIHYYDRELKKSFYVGDRQMAINPDAFPGMTKDGRIIYGATWNECRSGKNCEEKAGYVISDPNQSEDVKRFKAQNPDKAHHFKECITEADVIKVEREQATIYGLPLAKGTSSSSSAEPQHGTR